MMPLMLGLHCLAALGIIQVFLEKNVLSIYSEGSQQPQQGCVLWMHGLGASASDMMGLANELVTPRLRFKHVFLDAPQRPVTINAGMVMPAWYDISGMDLVDRVDSQGIAQSQALIEKAIDGQLEEGFEYQQIILAGFSQGGAMALHTALNLEVKLAGVIALSAYLPSIADTRAVLDKNTPFFIALGQFDSVVFPAWSLQSRDWLLAQGYQSLSCHQYPMDHSVCYEELQDLSQWMIRHYQGVKE
jgi:phospholipase/carboxylesterase